MMECLLAVELALCASASIAATLTATLVTISQGNLGGQCMLYGTVQYNVTGDSIVASTFSPSALCFFVSTVSTVVAVVSFCLLLCHCCLDCGNKVSAFLTAVTSGIFLFFLLVTGCVLKFGRDQLCDSVTHTVPNITRCDEAQSKVWASPYNGATFYSNLHKAETAVWVSLSLWMIIGILAVYKVQISSYSELRGVNGGSARTVLRKQQRERARLRQL